LQVYIVLFDFCINILILCRPVRIP